MDHPLPPPGANIAYAPVTAITYKLNNEQLPQFTLSFGDRYAPVIFVLKEGNVSEGTTADIDSANELRCFAPASIFSVLKASMDHFSNVNMNFTVGSAGTNAYFYSLNCSGFPYPEQVLNKEATNTNKGTGQVYNFTYTINNNNPPSFCTFILGYFPAQSLPYTVVEMCGTELGTKFPQTFYDGGYHLILPADMTRSVFEVLQSCGKIPVFVSVDSVAGAKNLSLKIKLPQPSNTTITVGASMIQTKKSEEK